MPAGRSDAHYGAKLRRIDFDALYARHDGYVLFEDLKAQWDKVLNVDYVLIDSRTGHTDIGGICTRQLPNAVIFVFWPNVQNLDGLCSIIREMHEEEKETERDIDRIFVPSNLPTLDDEDSVLRDLLSKFQSAMPYDPDDQVTIYSYPSLDLLAQKIFTVDRPKSRLAQEYRRLTDAIISKNMADVDGVREFLKRQSRFDALSRRGTLGSGREARPDELRQRRLESIIATDWEDPDINRRLAIICANRGEFLNAIRFGEKAMSSKGSQLTDFLYVAEWMIPAGLVPSSANLVVERLLDDDDSTQRHLTAAIRVLSRFNIPITRSLESCAAVRHITLQQAARVAHVLRSNRAEAKMAAQVAMAALHHQRALGEAPTIAIAVDMSLSLISSAYFRQAIELLEPLVTGDDDHDQQRVLFNLGMAKWGANGSVDQKDFEAVVAIDDNADGPQPARANYFQCLALSFAIVGNKVRALEYIGIARAKIHHQETDFSCWSYLELGEHAFSNDLQAIEDWIATPSYAPAVFTKD